MDKIILTPNAMETKTAIYNNIIKSLIINVIWKTNSLYKKKKQQCIISITRNGKADIIE